VTPAHELMLAYLRKASERNADLKDRVDSLTNTLKRCRESRDEWKRRAILYRKQKDALRNRLRDARASRDLWKHRALIASAAPLGRPVKMDVRAGMIGGDGGDGLPTLHSLANGEVRLDVADPVGAPAVGLEVDRLPSLR
jgi:hypothetical protein